VIPLQAEHSLQGSAIGAFSQFTALANIFAALVLPVPQEPENKYACENLLCKRAFCNVLVICSCPTTS
jgi:hypothetical protein